MNLLSDLALADSSFRVVAGRTVVSREGGMPALCDACNELLRVKPHAEKIIRDEILRLCSIPSHEAGHTLASALILVGRRKRAREVLELFPIVQAVVRRT